MAKGKRRYGDFCWISLMTPAFDRASSFFQKLFAWTYEEWIPGGRMVLVDDLPAGMLMDLAKCLPGATATIDVMIKVEDADAVVARVNTLGGRAEPAFDAMGNGRMAMCTDPTGADFSVWQPLSKDGVECDTEAHGAPTWFELLTDDPERAVRFYTELFGWEAVTEQPAPGMTYTLLKHGGVRIAGAMRFMPDTMGAIAKIPPHWGTYFAVRNTDETVRLAEEHGAEICVAPHDIPKVGRFSLMKSPQGVPFHVIQFFPQFFPR